MNVDADNPGETLGYTPSTSNELWKLRMASMAGYGPCGNLGPGLKDPMKPPKLLIVGLDIEVSTYARNGEMTLPHDDILSITISNGGWYTKEFKDICICMYTNGYVRKVEWEDGRDPLIVKVKSGGHAVETAYNVLKSINPDFVTIHNGFNYVLSYMAASCAAMDGITDTFDERRLGNISVGVFWRLPYGVMCVDTMYYAHKMENKVWNSFSLAYMTNRYELPPKLDMDTRMIDTSKENDMTNMIMYNCRSLDLHAWLAMRMKLCERVCVLAGLSRSPIWDSIANNAGKMVYCWSSPRP
jgi:DNA polymerase elongation subunit (family B)